MGMDFSSLIMLFLNINVIKISIFDNKKCIFNDQICYVKYFVNDIGDSLALSLTVFLFYNTSDSSENIRHRKTCLMSNNSQHFTNKGYYLESHTCEVVTLCGKNLWLSCLSHIVRPTLFEMFPIFLATGLYCKLCAKDVAQLGTVSITTTLT